MRPLTEEETRIFFEKLAKYIGRNIKFLIDRKDEPYCFRFHRDRVYYVREELMLRATNVARKELISMGTCFGKFTKTRKFNLQITCLQCIAPYALYKVWVKPSAEMSFLYGKNITKSGLGRITANTPQYQGVVVITMSDIPVGFGTTARSTQQCRTLEPGDVVCFNQADVGEYLRDEEHLT